MSLQVDYYKTLLLQTKRGKGIGKPSNAKIFFLLSLFKRIDEGELSEDKIYFDDSTKDKYLEECSKHPDDYVTPIYKPFFHLSSSPYYHIKWHGEDIQSYAHSPSAKYLREQVDYAYFDDELWALLQDQDTRNELRQALIDHFINND